MSLPILRADEYVRDMGNCPSVLTGLPTRVGCIGDRGFMESIDTVFEPGLTVKRNCNCVSVRAIRGFIER